MNKIIKTVLLWFVSSVILAVCCCLLLNVLSQPSEIVERTKLVSFDEGESSFKNYINEELQKEWKNVIFVNSSTEPYRDATHVRYLIVRFKVSGKKLVEQ